MRPQGMGSKTQFVAHKGQRHAQPVGGDSVACPLHDMGENVRPSGLLQGFGGLRQGLRRDNIVGVAVHQQDRRAHDRFVFQALGRQQAARKRDNTGHSIFAARRRLVAEFSGTVCAAGIVSYRKEFGVWPDDIKKAYTQFFPKRFNFDPYDREYGQFRFESVTRERGVETDDGRVSVTGCILYARNDDHEFNGASRHSAGGGSDDFVLWPPLRAVARGQGE